MKNPSGLCQCGCGRLAPLSRWSRRGYKRGEPLLYIKGHSSRKAGPEYLLEDHGHSTLCWIWQKAQSPYGYGHAWRDGKHHIAHRLFYESAIGSIPEGKELHHLCDQRLCVNPRHLRPVTRAEHMAADGRLPYGNSACQRVAA